MKPRFAAPAAALFCIPTVALAADTAVDLSSTVGLLTQLFGATLAALAIPLFWYGANTLKNHFGLSQLAIDESTRAVVDQGLQKAIGYAVAKVQEFTAGKPLTVDVKSDLIKHAADFALTHIPDALTYFGLDDPQKLAQTIEARLGILALQASTQAQSPAAPATAG
jgi:hypothetical protein